MISILIVGIVFLLGILIGIVFLLGILVTIIVRFLRFFFRGLPFKRTFGIFIREKMGQ